MLKQPRKRKLSLTRESLRVLAASSLHYAAGGFSGAVTCHVPCTTHDSADGACTQGCETNLCGSLNNCAYSYQAPCLPR